MIITIAIDIYLNGGETAFLRDLTLTAMTRVELSAKRENSRVELYDSAENPFAVIAGRLA